MRYLTLERLFVNDSCNYQRELNFVAVPPEAAEARDEEKGNDTTSNMDNGILQRDTARLTKVHSKKKFDTYKNSDRHWKNLKNQKLNI